MCIDTVAVGPPSPSWQARVYVPDCVMGPVEAVPEAPPEKVKPVSLVIVQSVAFGIGPHVRVEAEPDVTAVGVAVKSPALMTGAGQALLGGVVLLQVAPFTHVSPLLQGTSMPFAVIPQALAAVVHANPWELTDPPPLPVAGELHPQNTFTEQEFESMIAKIPTPMPPVSMAVAMSAMMLNIPPPRGERRKERGSVLN